MSSPSPPLDGRGVRRNTRVSEETIARAGEMLADPAISLAEVAGQLGVSRWTLQARIPASVRRRTGRGGGATPEAVIMRARELLADPTVTLTEAERRLGISRRTLAKYVSDRPQRAADADDAEEYQVSQSWPDPGPGGHPKRDATWQGQDARGDWQRGQ